MQIEEACERTWNEEQTAMWKAVPTHSAELGYNRIWVSLCVGPGAPEPSFTPVIQKIVHSNRKEKVGAFLQCQKCRISSLKRPLCEHEAAVTIYKEQRNDDLEQGGEASDIENGALEEENTTSDDESEQEDPAQRSVNENHAETSYKSFRKRSMLPCASDIRATKKILEKIINSVDTQRLLNCVTRCMCAAIALSRNVRIKILN